MQGNIYDTYDNKDFEYDYSITFKKRNKEYLEMISKATKMWTYGDAITLEFTISEDSILISTMQEIANDTHFVVVDLDEEDTSVLDIPILYVGEEDGRIGWHTRIEFYNFRYDKVFEYIADGYGSKLKFSLSKEDSTKYFKQGIYYFRMQFFNEFLDEQYTVSDNSETYFYVR